MGIKSDKTFEEIVERLVALVRPDTKETDATVVRPKPDTRDPDNAAIRPRPESPSSRRTR
jgi:hypothetical protein